MASWTDGPEYAPHERPSAFVAPAVAALEEPPATPVIEDAPPGVEPGFAPPEGPAPDLRALVPSAAPGRNANLPFETTSTPLTAVDAPTTGRDPQQPFTSWAPPGPSGLPVQPVVQPGARLNPEPLTSAAAPNWAPPSPDGQPIGPRPVSLAEVWKATTNWVMVPLIIGMIVIPISPVALLVASVSTANITFRRAAIRRAFQIAWVGIWVGCLVMIMADSDQSWWDPLSRMCTVGSWLLAFIIPGIVGSALRVGEPPEPR